MADRELKIKVPVGKKAVFGRPSRRNGLKKEQGHKAYHRRAKPGAGINFYDLGFYNGADHPFSVPIFQQSPPIVDEANLAARDTFYLALIDANYKTKFRKLDKENNDSYVFSIAWVEDPAGAAIPHGPEGLDDATEFTDANGLSLAADEAQTLKIAADDDIRAFFFWGMWANFFNKITTTHNSVAPGIVFTASEQMDILLMPHLWHKISDPTLAVTYPRANIEATDPDLESVGVLRFGAPPTPPIFLVAVIKSAGATYYVWTDYDGPSGVYPDGT